MPTIQGSPGPSVKGTNWTRATDSLSAIRGAADGNQLVLEADNSADLDLAESNTSVVCDGTEQTLYAKTGATAVYYFAGGFIDWTAANFGAGEDTTIQVKVKVDGTNYRTIYTETFLNAALPSPVCTPFPRESNTQPTPSGFYTKSDVTVTIQQAAVGGGWNTLEYLIVDAVRGA